MKKSKKAATYFAIVISFFMFYLFNRIYVAFGSTDGNVLEKITQGLDHIIPQITDKPFYIGTTNGSLIAGLIGAVLVWLVYLYNVFGAKNYMPGIEHGSARWGTPKDIANFIDPDPDFNVLLTATEKLSMSDRMKRTKTDDFNRNKNVLCVGSPGSGKTRFYVKPNIMQMHSSYVITDSKGSLIHECGKMLADNGYKIKVFDLINREMSDRYNPFEYIHSPDDILKLINNLILNTNSPQSKTAGDFWEKSETALLEAIFGYLFYEAPKDDQTIATALEMIRLAEVKEKNEDYVSPLDIIFEDLKEKDPNHFAVKQYDIFKLGAGRTLKSILISVGVRLSPFNIPNIAQIVSEDTIGLDMVGSEKTALFIIVPDTDRSFNFLAAMMFQQLFDTLVYRADHEYKGRLPFNVRCMMDEFANIGQIPDFKILISTVRSRGISVNIILQNLGQLKSLYKDDWETITGNCDSLLFLGGMEQSTLEYISKMCGKMTIDNRNVNESRGQTGSYSMQYQILGRDLITPDEVGRLKGRECILILSRNRPYRSQKYDIEKHKNYSQLSDADNANWFDISQRDGSEAQNFLSNIKAIVTLPELNSL